MIRLNILFLLLVQTAESISPPDTPKTPGVHFRQNNSDWIYLQPAVISKANASGLQLFVDTGAYTDMNMNLTCPGAKASVRISSKMPVLYVRDVGSAGDAMLIKLTKKKDKRVFKTSFSNVSVRNKGGYQKSDIYKLSSKANPDGSYSLAPEKNLPPGEYLLVFGNILPAYDFGIDRSK